MAETNRVGVAYVEETTYGVPAASVVVSPIRVTAAPDFGKNPKSEVSTELRADRQITDTILVNEEVGGSVNWELSYGAFDGLFEGVYSNDWKASKELVKTSAEITAIASNVVTMPATAGFVGADITSNANGHLVLLTGFLTTANNRIVRHVKAVAADTSVTLDGVVGDALLTDETAPVGARMKVVGFRKKADIAAVTISGSTASITSAAGDFLSFFNHAATPATWAPGSWIYIRGLKAAKCDGWCRIKSLANATIVFDIYPSTWEATSKGTLTVDIYFGDVLTNYATKKSYAIEESFNDLSPVLYQIFTGAVINTADFRMSAGAVLTGSFNLFGKEAALDDDREDAWGIATVKNTTPTTTITDLPSTQKFYFNNDVFNATSSVGEIREGGAIVGTSNTAYMMECSFQINNNLRRNTAVGVLGAANVAMGEWGVSGSMNFYFSSISMINKLLNQTRSSFNIKLKNDFWGTGQEVAGTYIGQVTMFEFPSIKFTSGNPSVSGKNADVMVNMGFQALMDATLGYTGLMQRFDYVNTTAAA